MFKANTQAVEVMQPGMWMLDVVRSALIGISEKDRSRGQFPAARCNQID
jgi:hypothetical protein